MAYTIAIASGKGGVGKTLLTASLALVLSRQGKKVLAVDADMGLRNLDLPLGLTDSIRYDVGHVLRGKCQPDEAVLTVTKTLHFLAASQKQTWEAVDGPAFRDIIGTLAPAYDYVVLDCPPGRGRAYEKAVAPADRVYFVIEPTWSSVRDTARLMAQCNRAGQYHYDAVFNNFHRHEGGGVSIDQMARRLDVSQLAGIVPHDRAVHEAAQRGLLASVSQANPFMQALAATAAHLLTGAILPVDRLVDLLPLREGQPERPVETPVATAPRPGLSLRQRQRQSMAWRFHRR